MSAHYPDDAAWTLHKVRLAETLWRGDPCSGGEWDDWPDNVDVGRYLYMAEQALRYFYAETFAAPSQVGT